MKRIDFAALALAALVALPHTLRAQDADAAARAAAQQEAEERYKRLSASVEELSAAQTSVQKKLAAITEELRLVAEELRKAASTGATAASRDDLRKLAETVAKLDEQRLSDKEVIVGELKKLGTAMVCTCNKSRAQTPVKPASELKASTDTAPGVPSEGFEYTIRDGDTLSTIIAAYRKEGIKVTLDLILKANPKLDPNRMQVGKKIFIPKPQ